MIQGGTHIVTERKKKFSEKTLKHIHIS